MAVQTTNATELTAEQVQHILIKPLEEASTFLACGPTIFDSASPIRIPKLGQTVSTGDSPAPSLPGWHGESEQIDERDVDFNEVELLPSTMKSVKVITRYSNEMARQSIVALDATIQQRLVTDVANVLDTQFWSDAGDGVTTPKGIFKYDGIHEETTAGAVPTLDEVTDAWGMALSANVSMSGLRWVMTPQTFVALRKIKEGSTSDRPILQPDVTQDAVFRLFGSPVTITSRLGRNAVVLADFSQIAVARDLAPSVKVLTERYADYDQQAIRVVARYDAGSLNGEGVVVLNAPAA